MKKPLEKAHDPAAPNPAAVEAEAAARPVEGRVAGDGPEEPEPAPVVDPQPEPTPEGEEAEPVAEEAVIEDDGSCPECGAEAGVFTAGCGLCELARFTRPEGADFNRFMLDEGAEASWPGATALWVRDDHAAIAAMRYLNKPTEGFLVAALTDDEARELDVWLYALCCIAAGNEAVAPPDYPAFLSQDRTEPVNEAAPEPAPTPEPPPVEMDQAVALLGDLMVNPYGLYLYPGQGYATAPQGPFYNPALIDAAEGEGLVFKEPTGGNHGSAKITPAGRAAYKHIRQAAPPEGVA